MRSGRAAVGVLAIVAISASGQFGPDGSHLYDWAVAVLVVLGAVVNWLVTRWKLDGATLRIETGLLRRDSRQLPVARIQAVDVVRPFLARALGLAELRVRLAGSSHADGRLAYLPEQAALDLRARLLAAHHGLDPATPEPGEQILASVPNGRLVGSVAASPASLLAALLVAEVVAILVSPKVFAAAGSTFVVSLITLAPAGVAADRHRVRLHRGAVAGRHPDPPRAARHGGGNHPAAPGAGGADGRARCCGGRWAGAGWRSTWPGPRAGTTPTGRAGCARPCSRSATASRPGS